MMLYQPPALLIAHEREPVLRLLKTNFEADGFAVCAVATAAACLAALRGRGADTLVLDAEIVRGEAPECAELLRDLITGGPPLVLLSWDPADRLLARRLRNALFVSRPDEIDHLIASVRDLAAVPHR